MNEAEDARRGRRPDYPLHETRIVRRGQHSWKTVSTKLRNAVIPFVTDRTRFYVATITAWSFDIWQASRVGWAHVHQLQLDEGQDVPPHDIIPIPAVSYAPFPRCIHCLRELHPESMTFCPGDHPVCAGCLSESAVEQVAQGNAQLTCRHLSGCRLPFAAVGLLLAQLRAAFGPHEDDARMPLVRDEQEEGEELHAAEGEEEQESHDAEQDEEQEEGLDATQSIQEHIDHCVGMIEQHKLRAAPDEGPSVVYPQSKGKGRVDAIESPSSESESEYDAGVDTDADVPVQHYNISRALIQSRQLQRGFNMGLRGEGPSRPTDPSGSVSAPPSPLKAPQAAERDQLGQAPATAPRIPTRVPQANRIAGFRFKQPSPALGSVYAELYCKVVNARKVREKVQQRRNVAETKVREGALGWSQGRLDLIIAEWDLAQEAVMAAELVLDRHRRAL